MITIISTIITVIIKMIKIIIGYLLILAAQRFPLGLFSTTERQIKFNGSGDDNHDADGDHHDGNTLAIMNLIMIMMEGLP